MVRPDDDLGALESEVMEDMQDIFASVDKTGEGVCVQASTLGSLEALLEFLKTPEVAIPVSAINIGPVHKRDVMRANVMIERGVKKYGVILAFDVPGEHLRVGGCIENGIFCGGEIGSGAGACVGPISWGLQGPASSADRQAQGLVVRPGPEPARLAIQPLKRQPPTLMSTPPTSSDEGGQGNGGGAGREHLHRRHHLPLV